MFRINKISLFSENKIINEYEFNKINYIHGPNAKGKTILAKIIDFMSGSSNNILSNKLEGLDYIDYIEMLCMVNDGFLFFKRDINNKYWIKYSEEELDYSIVDENEYKNAIMKNLINLDNPDLVIYSDVYEENLTFRAFSFLNFIDEIGIGDISNVFTRGHDTKYYFRMKNVIDFIFNYELVKEKKEVSMNLKEKKELLKKEKDKHQLVLSSISKIESKFKKYSLEYNNNMKDNYEIFKMFKNNFGESIANSSNDDLIKLLNISNELSNQIRIQKEMEKQSLKIISRGKKIKDIIFDFETIFTDTPELEKYKEYFVDILSNQKYTEELLFAKDYSKTIESYISEKKFIDEKIAIIKLNLSTIPLEEKMKDIAILEECFDNINDFDSLNYINKLEIEILNLKEGLKKIDNKIREGRTNRLDTIITNFYKNIETEFVKEDIEKENFNICFNKRSISVSGSYTKNKEKIYYLPGSLARMTAWQICTYTGMLKYLNENMKNIPILPFLCIDGLNQPFASNSDNYRNVLEVALSICNDIDIQLFVISTEYDDSIKMLINDYNTKEISLLNGLNSLHNKK